MAPSLESVPVATDPVSVKKAPAVEPRPSSELNGHRELSVKTVPAAHVPTRTFELEDHPIDAPSKIRVGLYLLCQSGR